MPTTQLTADKLTDGAITVIDLMVATGLCTSKNEARKLIAGGGVSVNGEKVADIMATVSEAQLAEGITIKKGKKTYHKVTM